MSFYKKFQKFEFCPAEATKDSFFACLDVYLLGTVMLVFGMGLYELFVSNLGTAKSLSEEKGPYRSNLFGLFTLKVSFKFVLVIGKFYKVKLAIDLCLKVSLCSLL